MAGYEIGSAWVTIMPSARGLSGKLTKVMNNEAGPAGDKAGRLLSGRLAKAIGGAAIGTAMIGGLKAAISRGAELEQSIGGVQTLYKENADMMIKYADMAYKTAGISANKYMEQSTSFAAALLQSTGGNTKKAGEAANQAIIDMSDNANKFGTDIERIQDAYQGFARGQYVMLDNLKLGYGGTKTEMERLLSDAEKISGVKYDISNLNDVYEAIHVIQQDLGVTGTTALEASTTISGSLASMKSAFDNFLGNLVLGREIEFSMNALAESAGTFLFGNLIPAVGRVFASLPTAITTFVQTGIPQLQAAAGEMVSGFADGAQAKFKSFVAQIPGKVGMFISGFSTLMTNLTGKLRTLAGKLIPAGLAMIKALATGIINNLPTLVSTVPKIIANLVGIIQDNGPKIIATGLVLIGKLAVGIIKAIPSVIAAVPKIIASIGSALLSFNWLALGRRVISSIASGIRNSGGAIRTAVLAPVRAAREAIVNGFSAAKKRVSELFTSIKNTIKEKIDAAKDTVKNVVDKIKGYFPLSIGKIFSNLQLPHISVSGGKAPFGIAGKGSLPSFSVSWFKKAENQPYMFTNATLIGAGERNDEILYGRRQLMSDIKEVSGAGREVTINNRFEIYDASDAHKVADEIAMIFETKVRTRLNGSY